MKNIFITGATGVLGKRVVKLLLEAGFDVTGLSRSPENTRVLEGLGAKSKHASLFNADELITATRNMDVIIHLATAIPNAAIPRKPHHWTLNDKIRIDGTKALLKAAGINQIPRFIQQSITRIYGNRNGNDVDAESPVGENLPFMLRSAVEMEKLLRDEGQLEHVILRFGEFYSADSITTQQLIKNITKRKMPVIGKGKYFWNYIHVDDAARAVMYALQRFEVLKNRTVNFTDFNPIRAKTALGEVARLTNSRSPYHMPIFLSRLILSNDLYETITASYKVVQDDIIQDWKPLYNSFPEGMKKIIEQYHYH